MKCLYSISNLETSVFVSDVLEMGCTVPPRDGGKIQAAKGGGGGTTCRKGHGEEGNGNTSVFFFPFRTKDIAFALRGRQSEKVLEPLCLIRPCTVFFLLCMTVRKNVSLCESIVYVSHPLY